MSSRWPTTTAGTPRRQGPRLHLQLPAGTRPRLQLRHRLPRQLEPGRQRQQSASRRRLQGRRPDPAQRHLPAEPVALPRPGAGNREDLGVQPHHRQAGRRAQRQPGVLLVAQRQRYPGRPRDPHRPADRSRHRLLSRQRHHSRSRRLRPRPEPAGGGQLAAERARATPAIPQNTGQRLLLGFDGRFAGWDYDIGASYNQNKVVDHIHSGYVDDRAAALGIANGTLNPFGPQTDAGSPTSAAMP